MASKRSNAGGLVAMVGGYVLVCYLLWAAQEWLWFATAVAFLPATLFLWIMLYRRATCDVMTRKGEPCRNRVRGRLRACTSHRREKMAYWLARVGMRRRAAQMLPRALTVRPQRAGREKAVTVPVTIDRSGSATVTLVCTLVTTAATVVSTVIALIGFASSVT